jgi:hypothetical protein
LSSCKTAIILPANRIYLQRARVGASERNHGRSETREGWRYVCICVAGNSRWKEGRRRCRVPLSHYATILGLPARHQALLALITGECEHASAKLEILNTSDEEQQQS